MNAALSKLPDGYDARRFDVHVGAPHSHLVSGSPEDEGYEGYRRYKTERGARRFAELASVRFGKTAHIDESWRRTGAWWVGGLNREGQLRCAYRAGEEVPVRVRLVGTLSKCGTVLSVGPEQSQVIWDGEERPEWRAHRELEALRDADL